MCDYECHKGLQFEDNGLWQMPLKNLASPNTFLAECICLECIQWGLGYIIYEYCFGFNELPIRAWNCVVRKLLEPKATVAIFSTQTHCKHSSLNSDTLKSEYIYQSHETNGTRYNTHSVLNSIHLYLSCFAYIHVISEKITLACKKLNNDSEQKNCIYTFPLF